METGASFHSTHKSFLFFPVGNGRAFVSNSPTDETTSCGKPFCSLPHRISISNCPDVGTGPFATIPLECVLRWSCVQQVKFRTCCGGYISVAPVSVSRVDYHKEKQHETIVVLIYWNLGQDLVKDNLYAQPSLYTGALGNVVDIVHVWFGSPQQGCQLQSALFTFALNSMMSYLKANYSCRSESNPKVWLTSKLLDV